MDYNIENIETQELILQFLKGELGDKEKKAFLFAMEKDKVLAKEVAINEAILLNNTHSESVNKKSVLAGIAASTSIMPNLEVETSEFDVSNSSNLKDSISTDPSIPPTKGVMGKWLGGIFIVGTGLVVSLWFTMPDLFYLNKEELIVAAAKEMIPLEDTFVLPRDEDSALAQGMSLYNDENYVAAIKEFKDHLSRHPDDSDVKLYLAVAQLFEGSIAESLSILEQLSVTDDPFLRSQSNWYASLAYLKNKQPSKAKILLEKLKKDKLYAKQAQKLLEQI